MNKAGSRLNGASSHAKTGDGIAWQPATVLLIKLFGRRLGGAESMSPGFWKDSSARQGRGYVRGRADSLMVDCDPLPCAGAQSGDTVVDIPYIVI